MLLQESHKAGGLIACYISQRTKSIIQNVINIFNPIYERKIVNWPEYRLVHWKTL